MKRIIFLLAFIALGITSSFGQARGTYGTIQPYNSLTGTLYGIHSGTVTAVSTDTLTDVDTGYVRVTFANNYDMVFDFVVTKLSGTVGGTALLQGTIDGVNWHTITGATDFCAGCQGASATITNTAGSKHYQWIVPVNALPYPTYQVQIISSGTMTATYSMSAGYKY